MCVEIIESYNDETNFNEKKANCKMQNFYILLALLLIPIALLPNKISNKAKKLLLFHDTNINIKYFPRKKIK